MSQRSELTSRQDSITATPDYLQGWIDGYDMGRRSFERQRAEGFRDALLFCREQYYLKKAERYEPSIASSAEGKMGMPMRMQWWKWRVKAWLRKKLKGRKRKGEWEVETIWGIEPETES